MEPLTTAELRALHALARYETATEAAQAAGLSPQTLRNQAHHAFKKLGVNGRVEAFRKIGWLRPPRFMPSADDFDPLRSGFEESRTKDPFDELAKDPNVAVLSRHQAGQLAEPQRLHAERTAKKRRLHDGA